MNSIALASLLFAAGLVLIVKGGDWFVDSASWIAEVSGIPKFLIGATIVSLATSMPEMLVSFIAAAQGDVDTAIDNAVGSVTANTGLIMGISVLAIPAIISRKALAPKILMLTAAVGLLWLFCSTGALSVTEGVVILVIFLAFFVENVLSAKNNRTSDPDHRPAHTKKDTVRNIVKFIVGAACTVVGAKLLVDNGETLALAMGVPQSVVAATMIAIGTSLPELVTTITAIVKKQASLSVGNIIGANIIDITLILPICAIISGGSLPMSAQGIRLDLPFCFAVTALALLPTLIFGRFRRWQGAALLLVYGAYLALMLI